MRILDRKNFFSGSALSAIPSDAALCSASHEKVRPGDDIGMPGIHRLVPGIEVRFHLISTVWGTVMSRTRLALCGSAVAVVLAILSPGAQAEDTILYQEPPTPGEFLGSLGLQQVPQTRSFAPSQPTAKTRSLVFPGSQPPAEQATSAAMRPQAREDTSRRRPAAAPRPTVAFPLTFAVNSTEISPQAQRFIDSVAAAMKLQSDLRLQISGHTDLSGAADVNLLLSQRRAESVRNYLVGQKGISPDRFEVEGEGSFRPLVPSDPRNPANRRVEFSRINPTLSEAPPPQQEKGKPVEISGSPPPSAQKINH
ncbi:OmpA family protein [Magnetospirillum molischianum]|uniref:OmpA-like domain-containing protein n=1 Tax=Magnetospirillum molischianum DSM 120 TaxID=1150626 RepID=H8FS53_MAGML|nr:OmpA family protein [Magnetospirillum molischianum]CCG41191.1 exported hypothetical protein [Magnetospirillum molischianum DSM 120]